MAIVFFVLAVKGSAKLSCMRYSAQVLGEFGGLGMCIPEHTYMRGEKASSYIMYQNPQELNAKYLEYLAEAKYLMMKTDISLSAIIYTELTDVEHEVSHAPLCKTCRLACSDTCLAVAEYRPELDLTLCR